MAFLQGLCAGRDVRGTGHQDLQYVFAKPYKFLLMHHAPPLKTDWILLQVTSTFEAIVGGLPSEAFITSYGCEENLRCESR